VEQRLIGLRAVALICQYTAPWRGASPYSDNPPEADYHVCWLVSCGLLRPSPPGPPLSNGVCSHTVACRLSSLSELPGLRLIAMSCLVGALSLLPGYSLLFPLGLRRVGVTEAFIMAAPCFTNTPCPVSWLLICCNNTSQAPE
jgi:hypothetical protein